MLNFRGNGETYSGYLARSTDGSGPGVIVLQEWWGLVGHITDVCDRFAAESFTALAPDLYRGTSTTDPDEAGTLMMALNIEETEKILRGAVDALIDDEATEGEKVGVIGFCMGGQLALYAAAVNPKIGACVDFYGIHPKVHPPLENLQAPVLGIFAEFDEYASHTAVNTLQAHLTNLDKQHEFHTYPGAHHAFFNDARPEVYDKQAAEDAWERVLTFLHRHLK
jgi:carboxymethylenebutenolidase